MSFDDYRAALRAGQKEYRTCVSRGEYPYLQVLDEILDHAETQGETSLGLVDIPTEQIAGTKTAGRRAAFARNFMPLLDAGSEFAAKWTALCSAHLEEGIREPVAAYEFMNRFYIAEGNKRVSVLKFFGAVSIPGTVIRIVPKRQDTVESRLYFEFLDFYRLTQINYLWFSQPGRFRQLLSLLGKEDDPWSSDDRSAFFAAYTLFRKVFDALGGAALPMTAGDALLAYLKIYGAGGFYRCGEGTVRSYLSKSWSEIAVQNDDEPVELVVAPQEAPAKRSLLTKLLDARPKTLKAAFLYQKAPETTKWTYGHEMGRRRVEKALQGRVETVFRENVAPEIADGVIEEVVAEGCQVVFTTNPKLLPATLRRAVEHPETRFLNCSLNMPHPSLRTYYGRMYEAKFLAGVIAGAATENGRIGYIADYPICGVTANINAFALGAQMVNPRAKVYLEWSSQRSVEGILERFHTLGTDVVSNQDLLSPRQSKREFGLYRVNGDDGELMCATAWNWGRFYELILRDILDGGWSSAARETKAINYWWGLSAGVVDLYYAKALPSGTRRLVGFLREALISGTFRPFAGKLYAQDRVVQEEGELDPARIVGMDWLAENVNGSIPAPEELTEEARKLVALQGIHRAAEGPACPTPEVGGAV